MSDSEDLARLLQAYTLAVSYPDSSGIEHDHMLFIRDGLHDRVAELGQGQLEQLHLADNELISNAPLFLKELRRFVNLPKRRCTHSISPERWWWYLDVLAHLPHPAESP